MYRHGHVSQNSGGATGYKVDRKCIFLNQATLYGNRGPNFAMYNQLEFECILVGLLKRKSAPAKKSNEKRGRTQHVGFDLGSGHPLFALLKGFVRAKFRTPILPVVLPKFPGKNL